MSVDDINRHITLEGVERVEKEFRESGKALCVLYLGWCALALGRNKEA